MHQTAIALELMGMRLEDVHVDTHDSCCHNATDAWQLSPDKRDVLTHYRHVQLCLARLVTITCRLPSGPLQRVTARAYSCLRAHTV